MQAMTRLSSFVGGLTAALLLCIAGAAAAQDAPQGNVLEVQVPVGHTQVVEMPGTFSQVNIGDPATADVMPLNTHSVYVVGKALGSTSLTVYGARGRLLAAVSVVVTPDIDTLKLRLHEILPAESRVEVRAANQSIVLSGSASSAQALHQITSLAETFAPTHVVNMMTVEGVQQVMLSVRFVEMRRTTSRDLRINVDRALTGGNPQFQVTTGDTLNAAAGTVLNSFGLASAIFHAGDGDLTLLFDALETRGLVRTLAEPHLVAMSGDTANFLAGGEFPVPVSATAGAGATPTITVEFKQFGVGLAFTPTILSDGLINLAVDPEVSSIDPTTSVNTGLISIPGLRVSRTHTTVELRDGESFTIAGLLRSDYQNSIRQFPFIGDIPVIGALFRSTGFQREETELVIVVTPHLVTPRRGNVATPNDNFVPPSDFELFLLGAQRGSQANVRPEDRVLIQRDPTGPQGGVDGPYGHVLY
jgi:pilus assembly protein CpaC